MNSNGGQYEISIIIDEMLAAQSFSSATLYRVTQKERNTYDQ